MKISHLVIATLLVALLAATATAKGIAASDQFPNAKHPTKMTAKSPRSSLAPCYPRTALLRWTVQKPVEPMRPEMATAQTRARL